MKSGTRIWKESISNTCMTERPIMITRIAQKEMTEMFRDGRFRLAFGIVAVLLLVSLGAGWKQYSTLKNQHETAQAAERMTAFTHSSLRASCPWWIRESILM